MELYPGETMNDMLVRCDALLYQVKTVKTVLKPHCVRVRNSSDRLPSMRGVVHQFRFRRSIDDGEVRGDTYDLRHTITVNQKDIFCSRKRKYILGKMPPSVSNFWTLTITTQ